MHNLKVTFLVHSPRFGYHNVVEQVLVYAAICSWHMART